MTREEFYEKLACLTNCHAWLETYEYDELAKAVKAELDKLLSFDQVSNV